MKKAVELKKDGYTLQVNYSKEAKEKKLMKFIPTDGKPFVISADEMGTILSSQINSQTLEAIFVESDRVDVVEVERQMRCLADKDIKKGDEIRITYKHPLPVEFALIEEAWRLAEIKKDVPIKTLSVQYIKKARDKMKPIKKNNETFLKSFYAFFKNIKIP